jgi:hypothetical protein
MQHFVLMMMPEKTNEGGREREERIEGRKTQQRSVFASSKMHF